MTTKASPPSTTSSTTVNIKKEIPSDEIKDFAETAMNELLGWYGYDSVDRIDLSSKSSQIISTPSLNASENHNSRIEINGNRSSHREDSTTSDHDSSREDSKSPGSIKNSGKQETFCAWCRRQVLQNTPEFLASPDGPRYCSESCFSQSRRASFKRAKTCDWCRHIRHAVSYVDFQDGASQLQFCSDKCLNQYKMQIFCKETQAHLDMNPHLKEKSATASSGGLITPDLWLKNCRSRSASPVSELSRSPTPIQLSVTSQTIVHKPIISVTPTSKLMSRPPTLTQSRQSLKHARKRRSSKINTTAQSASNNSMTNATNSHTSSSKILANCLTSSSNLPKSCNFPNVQDLRLNVPPISPVENPATTQRTRPPSFFAPSQSPFSGIHRPPGFMPAHPRLFNIPHHQLPPIPPIDTFSAPLAPVTLVPYPIIVPLPIPIPIPLPIIDFLKAANLANPEPTTPRSESIFAESSANADSVHAQEPPNEPLDFTKSKTLTEPDPHPKNDNNTSDPIQLLRDSEFTPTTNAISPPHEEEGNDPEPEQKLLKLKITRLHSKRSITKESENSRPLRKRKRVIDCDYLRTPKDDDDSCRPNNKK